MTISQKIKLYANITDEYRYKNFKQNTSKQSNTTLKDSYTLIKWDLSQEIMDFSIYANQ